MNKGYESIAAEAATLGSLFYHDPVSEKGQAALAWLQNPEAASSWSSGQPATGELIGELGTLAAEDAAAAQDEGGISDIHLEFNRLFIGPSKLPAPAWASVYLDPESVIFGNETLEIRQWMRENGVQLTLPEKEPEDHFGLMLMMLSFAATQGLDDEQIDTLLAHHLMPWAPHFLDLFEKGAQHPFYVKLAQLTQATLNDWVARFDITVEERHLYR